MDQSRPAEHQAPDSHQFSHCQQRNYEHGPPHLLTFLKLSLSHCQSVSLSVSMYLSVSVSPYVFVFLCLSLSLSLYREEVGVCMSGITVTSKRVPENPCNWSYKLFLAAKHGCWEPNSRLLQKQHVLLTTKPSIQPHILHFLVDSRN